MNYYQRVKRISEELKDDYKELTVYESLDIATKIVQSETIGDGLLVNNNNDPTALEAVAMILGYKKHFSTSIVDAISEKE